MRRKQDNADSIMRLIDSRMWALNKGYKTDLVDKSLELLTGFEDVTGLAESLMAVRKACSDQIKESMKKMEEKDQDFEHYHEQKVKIDTLTDLQKKIAGIISKT